MKVKKATVEDVKAKIAAKKLERTVEKGTHYNYEERVKELKVGIKTLSRANDLT